MNIDKFNLLNAHYGSACKSTDYLKDYWNKVSGIYVNAGYSVFQAGLLSNDFDEHLDLQFARRKINPSRKNILDAGCGIGTSLKHMAAKRPDASFVGLNISDVQIEEASKDLPKNVEISEGDNMPFESDTFDLVIFDVYWVLN